jgi:hypothetical protein
MNKVALLLVGAALCGPCLAQNANKAPVGANAKTVKITGTITNFVEFKAAVVPGFTYIQLVNTSGNGNINITADGLVWFDSDLPKLPVPKNAAFSFNVHNVPPGKYIIAAQKLNGSDKPFFVTTSGNTTWRTTLFTIDVTADAKSPITINAGKLIVILRGQ